MQARWGERVQFAEVLVRQEHPGPAVPPYHDIQGKVGDAQRYRREEGIPWPIAADDLEGSAHQVYGGLADPTYLIDADGRVAFYNMWTHAPTLHIAIAALLAQGGRGVVNGGIDRFPHFAAALTDGWKGLRRGLPQSLIDMETAGPGTGVTAWLGYQLRPILAPLTLRATPLPLPARLGLLTVAAVAALAVLRARWRRGA